MTCLAPLNTVFIDWEGNLSPCGYMNKEHRVAITVEDIKKDLQNQGTKIAIIESKLTDISSNVSHLMWHHQALPTKDVQEQ